MHGIGIAAMTQMRRSMIDELEGSRLGLEDGAVKRRSLVNRNGRNFVAAVSRVVVWMSDSRWSRSPADAKPSWQVTWENTVAAAKKEGRLNFYVGRYGSEPLLERIPQRISRDQNIQHQRRRQFTGHAHRRRSARRQRAGGSLQRRGGDEFRNPLQGKGPRFAQVGVDTSRSS